MQRSGTAGTEGTEGTGGASYMSLSSLMSLGSLSAAYEEMGKRSSSRPMALQRICRAQSPRESAGNGIISL